MNLDWFRENASRFQGTLHWNEPLARHTYYKIGGPAELLIVPQGIEDLRLIREGLQNRVPPTTIGLGSNLLVSDSGLPGVVVKTSRIDQELRQAAAAAGDSIDLQIGSSVTVTTLLRHAGKEGWDGLELLAGIPGSIGGVVAMNGGTHLGEAKDLVRSARIFSWTDPSQDREIELGPQNFEYRKNKFLGPNEIVLSSGWRVKKGDPVQVHAKITDVLTRRKASQPLDYPSCGSVFKNPHESGKRAWEVIDSLGLRGKTIGHAQFSEKHPNFIINLGGAQAEDVAALIRLAKTEALSRLSITLEEEVKLLGRFSEG